MEPLGSIFSPLFFSFTGSPIPVLNLYNDTSQTSLYNFSLSVLSLILSHECTNGTQTQLCLKLNYLLITLPSPNSAPPLNLLFWSLASTASKLPSQRLQGHLWFLLAISSRSSIVYLCL